MIGGVDIVMELHGMACSDAMAAALRSILHRWPLAILQNTETGEHHSSLSITDARNMCEVLVYQDEPAFLSWARLGADPTNAGQMIHLLCSDGQFTIVVDDADCEMVCEL